MVSGIFRAKKAVLPGLDISHATWLFAHHLRNDPHREQRLQSCAFALSLFGPLEPCHPGVIDHRQDGLVIRSKESPWKMGGALPCMPGISSDAQLLHHARFQNTSLFQREPYDLYRHPVTKLIEPGAEWPYGGESDAGLHWDEKEALISPLANELWKWVEGWHCDRHWPDSVDEQYIPPQCQWLFLSVYLAGKPLACVGTVPKNAAALFNLVQMAAQDPRWQSVRREHDIHNNAGLYIRLSWLSQSRYLGYAAGLDDFSNLVIGQDAVAIQHEKQFSLILPEVPLEQHWGRVQLTDALYQKAGISREVSAVHWRSYRTTTWQADGGGCQRLNQRIRLPTPRDSIGNEQLMQACQHFLQQHCQPNGIINSHYSPALHQVYQQDVLFNTAYILSLLNPAERADSTWQICYQYVAAGLSEAEADSIDSLTQSYCLLALLNRSGETYQELISAGLNTLHTRFSRHGQLRRPESDEEKDHFGIELYVLLHAQQKGFKVDDSLLSKAVKQLVNYATFQATPRQFPLLIQLLTLIRDNGNDLEGIQPRIEAVLTQLIDLLLQWQQASGAFMPEVSGLSPVLFTLKSTEALLGAGVEPNQPVQQTLDYLKQHVVVPSQQQYFQSGSYALGGMYSGLFEGSFSVVSTAWFYKLLNRINDDEGLV